MCITIVQGSLFSFFLLKVYDGVILKEFLFIFGDIYFSSSSLAQGSPLDDQDRQDADHEQYHLIVELEQHLESVAELRVRESYQRSKQWSSYSDSQGERCVVLACHLVHSSH